MLNAFKEWMGYLAVGIEAAAALLIAIAACFMRCHCCCRTPIQGTTKRKPCGCG